MVAVRKFLFDTSFDDVTPVVEEMQTPEEESEQAEAAEGEAIEPEEEEVVTYSEEELNGAREQAFQAGREEGVREAADATEQQAASALQAIGESLPEIFQLQQGANDAHARNAVMVAVAIVRKVFPDLNRKGALGEVERVIEVSMEKLMDPARIVIRVNEELRDGLAQRIEAATVGGGFQENMTVLADAGVAPGDCRIEWSDGGAERDTDAMWQEIDDIIMRNVGADPEEQTSAETADDL